MNGPDPELILNHVGRSLDGEPYPQEYRRILISSVLSLVSAAELHQTLTKNDPGFSQCQNTVNNWLIGARVWLGFKKSRKEVRTALPEWYAINGKPTIDDIRAGWVPLHHRSESSKIPMKTSDIMPASASRRVSMPSQTEEKRNPPTASSPKPAAQKDKTSANENADEFQRIADEARKMGSKGITVKSAPEETGVPEFVGPTAPAVDCTDEERIKYRKLRKAALAAYVAKIRSMGYELLEPYDGFKPLKCRKKEA